MTEKNPFTISFNRKPFEYIDRNEQTDLILDTFRLEPATDQIFIITGVRGSGKTVLMTTVAAELEKDKSWHIENCIGTRDMVHELAANLSNTGMKGADASAQTGLLGAGSISVGERDHTETDISMIRNALKVMNKKHQKLLITVDEISNTHDMQDLCFVFAALIREELPIYFLGTAAPENIDSLKNVQYLTFLYRAPRIELPPLDMLAIAYRYQSIFKITEEESKEMAKLTKGYSFAFQALGYVCWKKRPTIHLEEVLPEYDRLLAANSYAKIWTELSKKQRVVCRAIAECRSDKVSDIRKAAGMNSNNFNGYRNRLLMQGILMKNNWGTVVFTLPRFAEFILNAASLYEFNS